MTTTFACIGLVTSDLASSLTFYRGLGIDIPPDAGSEPHVEAPLPGGLRLLWDTEEMVRSFDPEWTPPRGNNRIGLAFDCHTPVAVDETYAELTSLGYRGHHKPWDAPWGQRYATVLDPDGNPVDLYAALTSDA